MLDICLLGCGGMMPLPYRWLTALMMRYNGSSLLIDCGEGTQIAVKEKGWSFKPIDTICFTHYHGDHISGLPGLLLTMGNADRTEPLTLIGPKGLERVVNALRVIAPELPFPIIYKEIQGNEQIFEEHGYRIRAFRVNHNVICYGYTVEIARTGRFDVERAKAAEIPMKFWNRLQKGETIEAEGRTFMPEYGAGRTAEGHQADLLYRYPAYKVHRGKCCRIGSFYLRGHVWRAGKRGQSQGIQAYDLQRGGRACPGCGGEGDVADPLQPVAGASGGLYGRCEENFPDGVCLPGRTDKGTGFRGRIDGR